MSEERFDRIDATLQQLVARFDAVDKRFDAVEMGLEKLKVLHDETRGKVDLVLEHVVATNERLDRFELYVKGRFDEMKADVHVMLRNHNTRLGALEGRP